MNSLFNKSAGPLLVVCIMTVLITVGCSLSPKERANPLDPLYPTPPLDCSLSLVDIQVDTAWTRKIRLDWAELDHVGLVEYHVFRRVPVESEGFVILDVIDPPVTTYTDLECVVDSAYYYRVTALLGDGTDSVLSEEVRYLGRYDERY